MNEMPVLDAGQATDVPLPPPPSRPFMPGAAVVSLVGIFLILLAGALYFARAFFLPLILALLITLTFRPLARLLQHRGIPPAISAILIVAAIGGVFAGAAVFLAAPVSQMVDNAPAFAEALKKRISDLKGPLSALQKAGDQVQDLAKPDAEPSAGKVTVAGPGILPWAAGTIRDFGATIATTLVFTIFLLASGDLFLLKIVRATRSLSEKKRSLRIVHDIENEVSRYLLTVTMINAAFGCVIGGVMALFGMPHPLIWGIAAALLNFIPYLGAVIGIGLTTAVGLMTFPTLTMAALPPLAYLAVHLIESLAVTPMTLGRRLELNTVAILIALALAGWIWGIVGALIAVPLLVVIKVFCDHFPRLATFGEFLSGDTGPVEAAEHAPGTAGTEPSAGR